ETRQRPIQEGVLAPDGGLMERDHGYRRASLAGCLAGRHLAVQIRIGCQKVDIARQPGLGLDVEAAYADLAGLAPERKFRSWRKRQVILLEDVENRAGDVEVAAGGLILHASLVLPARG